jgi:hypothetical protein
VIQVNESAEVAAWAASRGWAVLKVRPDKKVPAEKWATLGYRTPDEIRLSWGSRTYSVGILTGPSNLVDDDLDVDDEGNPAGDWELWDIANGREIPRTFTLATPSGGTHLVWAKPNGREFKNSSGTHSRNGRRTSLIPGAPYIDVRGTGGMFVLWSPDHKRIITDDRDPVLMPKWLADLHPEPGVTDGTIVKIPSISKWMHDYGGGDMCEGMKETLGEYLSRFRDNVPHEAMKDAVWALVGERVAGHQGLKMALDEVWSKFERAMRGKTREREKVEEWRNAVNGAIGKKLGRRGSVSDKDPCRSLVDLSGDPVKNARAAKLLVGEFDGEWLSNQKFDPLVWAIPEILPEGLTVMAGPPKVGKSVMLLRFGIEVARAGHVFGQKIDGMPVFYLALEDKPRRLQARCEELLAGGDIPKGIRFKTEIQPGKLLETVEAWLDRNEYGLVLVDTLGRALSTSSPNKGETTYDRDYRVVARLKTIADEHNSSPVVISHHSKKGKVDDWLEIVSGTNAITGAADTILAIARERGQQEGFLRIAGRDVDDCELSTILERPYGWLLDGADLLEAAGHAAEKLKPRERRDSLGERSQDIIDHLEANGTQAIGDVASACGLSNKDATTYLLRLWKSGHIEKPKRGYYGPVHKATIRKKGKD